MSAAEAALMNMSKAGAVVCVAPNGTATCPNGIIRIGVFFDGTGNNMWRDWDNGVSGALNPDGELTGPTNVAKLWHLFIDDSPDIQHRVYHHGPGTDSYGDKPRSDHPGWIRRKINAARDAPGMLLGEGGKERSTWGLKQLSDMFSKNTNPLAVEKLVDAYGFSRGAAIARDFMNRVILEGIDNTKVQSGYRYIVIPGAMGGAATVRVPAYERHKNVILNFLGAFDTVASFNLGGANAGNFAYNFFIDHTKVKHSVHMMAEDETRFLFPVSSFFMDPNGKGYQEPSDYSDNLVELWYPGVHSDVGGSYLTVPEIPGKPATTGYTYSELGAQSYDIPAVPVTPTKQPQLAHIPLRDMHKASQDRGVPLRNLSTLPARLWNVPKQLEDAYNAYDAYRKDSEFSLDKRYIHNYEVNKYHDLFFKERALQPSVIELRTHFMHDEKGWYDRERHKRTVLFMGKQPKKAG